MFAPIVIILVYWLLRLLLGCMKQLRGFVNKFADDFFSCKPDLFCKVTHLCAGKYDPDNENPRKWKANFRCALNSLPDVIIVPGLCNRKGKDAYRVFKILPEKIPEKVRESMSTRI